MCCIYLYPNTDCLLDTVNIFGNEPSIFYSIQLKFHLRMDLSLVRLPVALCC